VKNGYVGLAVLGVMNSAVSIHYSLRPVAYMYMLPAPAEIPVPRPRAPPSPSPCASPRRGSWSSGSCPAPSSRSPSGPSSRS
jgi:hypothetical protein